MSEADYLYGSHPSIEKISGLTLQNLMRLGLALTKGHSFRTVVSNMKPISWEKVTSRTKFGDGALVRVSLARLAFTLIFASGPVVRRRRTIWIGETNLSVRKSFPSHSRSHEG